MSETMNESRTYFDFYDALILLNQGKIEESEFNAISLDYENTVENDPFHPLAESDKPGNVAWEAKNGRLYSPFIRVGSFHCRLSVDYVRTVSGRHINAKIHIDGQSPSSICLVTVTSELDQIVAVWDYVAREGVDRAVEAGIVTRSWSGRVEHAGIARCADPIRLRRVYEWADYYDLDPLAILENLESYDAIRGIEDARRHPYPNGRDLIIIAEHGDREWLNLRECKRPRNWTEYFHDVEHRVIIEHAETGPRVFAERVRLN